MGQIKKCPRCMDSSDFCVTTKYQLECGYCGLVIANIKPQWQAITHPHCIVTQDDKVLDKELSLAQAEQRLHYYLQHKEDCYIGLTKDFT